MRRCLVCVRRPSARVRYWEKPVIYGLLEADGVRWSRPLHQNTPADGRPLSLERGGVRGREAVVRSIDVPPPLRGGARTWRTRRGKSVDCQGLGSTEIATRKACLIRHLAIIPSRDAAGAQFQQAATQSLAGDLAEPSRHHPTPTRAIAWVDSAESWRGYL